MQRILITGASGFLGSALALHLLDAGHQPALLLRPTSRVDRLKGLDSAFEIGRCGSEAEISAFVARVQPATVIHTACLYGRHDESHLQIVDANIRFGLVILQTLLDTKRPVTFINTSTVLSPDVSPYALSKDQFAQWGRLMAARSAQQLRFVNVLLQHMYGPGDDMSKFTAHVLRACRQNEPLLELTAGEQERDFIYIDDVVSAYSALLKNCNELEQVVDIDVGFGVAPTIRDFVETVHRLTSSRTKLMFGALPYRPNEAMQCKADVTRLKALGWRPEFDLETGLARTIELENSK